MQHLVLTQEQLILHENHKIEPVKIGNELSLECITCQTTIGAIAYPTRITMEVPKVCSMDEGGDCESCGS